jgi:hypothetical protein
MAVVIVAWQKETISRRDANKLLGETLIYSHFPRTGCTATFSRSNRLKMNVF